VRTYEEIRVEDRRLQEEGTKRGAAIARGRQESARLAEAGRMEASREFERKLATAVEQEEVLGRHAERCGIAARMAARKVEEFRREHAVRISALLAGFDRLPAAKVDRETGSDALDTALARRAKRIVHGDPRVLDELAPAFLALDPEMGEALRATLRDRLAGLADRDDCAVSGLPDEEYEVRLAGLKQALEAARQEAEEAKGAADAAIARRRRLERRGH
jgi:hypothetical protein